MPIKILGIVLSFFILISSAGATMSIKDEQFNRAIEFIFKAEGGYSKRPDEEVKYGITSKSYPHLNIKKLTKEKAKELYYRDYWLKSGAHRYKDFPTSLLIMDTAVLQGVSKAKELTEKAQSFEEGMSMRKKHLQSIGKGSNKKFLKGWMNRLSNLEKYAQPPKETKENIFLKEPVNLAPLLLK